MRREVIASLALSICIFALYAPVRHLSFIYYDDPVYVYENPHVNTGLTFANVRWAFTTRDAANWHPLTWISHQLDVSVFGPAPAGHHFVNVLLHAANASLLLVILSRLTGQFWLSAVSAALFALHPLRVESVVWIAERKDLLCGFFSLLTIAVYEWYVRLSSQKRMMCVALTLLLALMSKPMAVTLPFVLLLLDVWPLGRLKYDGWRGARSLVFEKALLFGLVLAASAMTLNAQSAGGATRDVSVYPLPYRLANAVVSSARYIVKIVWPHDLVILYPHPSTWNASHVLGSAGALLLLVSTIVLLLLRRTAAPLVGWLWFLGMLVPVIGIVQVGDQSMADRYTYLPSIGLTIAVVWGVYAMVERHADMQRALLAASAVVAVILFVLTARQIHTWKDGSIGLMTRAIALQPNNWPARWQLGAELAHNNDDAAAADQFRAALKVHPQHAGLHYALANVYLRAGKLDAAMHEYGESLAIAPQSFGTWNNLGITYARMNDWRHAAWAFQHAVQLDQTSTAAFENYQRAVINRTNQLMRATTRQATTQP